jgi:hypothetical protein
MVTRRRGDTGAKNRGRGVFANIGTLLANVSEQREGTPEVRDPADS